MGKQEHNLRALLDLLDLPTVVHWPNKERVLLGWLIGRADEHGEGWADPGVIGGAIWPGRPGLSKATRIRQTLAMMAQIRVNGRRLIMIENGRYRLLPDGGPSCPDPVPIRSARRTALSRSGPRPIKGRARGEDKAASASVDASSVVAVSSPPGDLSNGGCSGCCVGGRPPADAVPLPPEGGGERPPHFTPPHGTHGTHEQRGGLGTHGTHSHPTSPHFTAAALGREGDGNDNNGGAEAAEDGGMETSESGERTGARDHLAPGYTNDWYHEFDASENLLGGFTPGDWDCVQVFVARAARENGAFGKVAALNARLREKVIPRKGLADARNIFFWAIGPRGNILPEHGRI